MQRAPRNISPRVLEFCRLLSPGFRPLFVSVNPAPGAKMLNCHPNVAEKVKNDGGSHVFGWSLSVLPKIHLEAQFHSVWRSPSGKMVDVTPEESGQSKILFLEDPLRTYTGTKVKHERFALGDEVLVGQFWSAVDAASQALEDLLAAGFEKGDPIFSERLGPLFAEADALRRRLQG